MYEVDWEGNIVWKWSITDHFDELGFDEAAKNVLARDPNMRTSDGGVGDYLHVNCMSYLGPNKWHDQGDLRFKPDNIIFDSREANILAIIDKETGKIVWKIGPDFNATPELRKLGWIIGQHHLHMIPKGLPGEGNLLAVSYTHLLANKPGTTGFGADLKCTLCKVYRCKEEEL